MIYTDLDLDLEIFNIPGKYNPYMLGEVSYYDKESGEIKKKLYVLNTETNQIMDYYFEDIEDPINLGIWDSRFSNYTIDKKGNVFYLRYKKYNKTYLNNMGYVTVSLKRHPYAIHRLLGMIFIPTKTYDSMFIDHIDRNRSNNKLSNLRWVTPKENSNNRTNIGKYYNSKRTYYIAYKDSSFEEEIFRCFEDDLDSLNIGINLSSLTTIISQYGKYPYKGYYWKKMNSDLTDHLKKINVSKIDENLWKKVEFPGWENYNFEAHPSGLIRKNKIILRSTYGPTENERYKFVGVGGKNKNHHVLVHRIIAGVFLNENKPVPDNLVVDHIDTNKWNNQVSNLRIVTQSENMKNPITQQKIKTTTENNKKKNNK